MLLSEGRDVKGRSSKGNTLDRYMDAVQRQYPKRSSHQVIEPHHGNQRKYDRSIMRSPHSDNTAATEVRAKNLKIAGRERKLSRPTEYADGNKAFARDALKTVKRYKRYGPNIPEETTMTYTIHELNLIAEALSEEPEVLDELSDKMHHRYRRLAKSDIADTKMGGKIKAPGSYTAAGFTPGDRARAKAMIKKRRDGISLSRYLQYGAE